MSAPQDLSPESAGTSWRDQFAAALLDSDRAPPTVLRAWNGSDPARRFSVYRNNVVVALVDALAETFPVCGQLVGEAFFRAMAQAFVRAHPPRSPLLFEYGDAFPDFIAGFPPAGSVPYLADVARLEALRVAAFHAADADVPSLEDWAGLDPAQLASMRFELHPSLGVVASAHAVFSLWAAHQGALDIAEVDPERAETALVVRPRLQVEVVLAPPGTGVFLRALEADEPLGAAAGMAGEADPAFDPAAVLGLLMRTGAVASARG